MWRGRRAAQAGLVSVVATCLVFAFCPSLASAESGEIPPFTGSMGFKSITGPEGPEEFSWRVHLDEGQDLRQVDDQSAAVYFTEPDHLSVTITAAAAHDAHGTSVPTTLAVTGADVITLTVHHRAGNPVAGGAAFVYPVIAGEGWEGPIVIIDGGPLFTGPRQVSPDEEFAHVASSAASGPSDSPLCRIPNLTGRSLAASKRQLRKAHCRIGRLSKRKGATARSGKVVSQVPRPGTSSALWTPVRLTLGAAG